jgi:hypothetical protein
MKRKILVSITTITDNGWKEKIKEIKKLKIKEVALFPTCLNIEERKELYKELEKTDIVSIPLVHAREDFATWELDYLVKIFKTKAFNFHYWSGAEKFLKANKKYRRIVFFENLLKINDDFKKFVKLCGGVCLDVSHWESIGIMKHEPTYKNFDKMLDKYKVGCNHISAISNKRVLYIDKKTDEKFYGYDCHWLKDIHEMDYVKKYLKYLSDIVAIELENSIKEQLQIKKYLESIIK